MMYDEKAPRPVMVLRVEATTKVAGLLDRAAMVLNQTSAPQGTPPPTHSKVCHGTTRHTVVSHA
jgi:hypothetical protein